MNLPTLLSASDSFSSERAKQLSLEQREQQYRRTDRLFSVLLLAEFVAGIGAALWISPFAWAGQDQKVHPHVWSAVWLGALIVSLPIFLARVHPGKALTRHVIGVAQLLMSGLLIHLTQGRIETHFHVFGSLAFLAFYRDWRVLVTASAVTTIDHLVRGYVWPLSIYGVELQSKWRWLEHAGWVIFEDLFLIFACQQSNRETNALGERQSQLEATNTALDRKVEERTAMLLATEERFELAVRGSTDGLWDWNVLTNGVYFSPRLKELLGYSEEELPNVFETFESRLHPDDHDWVLREVDEHLQHRKIYDVEYRLRTKTGEYRWFRARGQAIWNDAGQPQRMAGSITDITERKRSEEEAKLVERRMNLVLEGTETGIWDLDLIHDRAWRSLLHDRVFGYDSLQPEWNYEIFLSHVVPEDLEQVKKTFQDALTRDNFTLECRVCWPDQSAHWISVTGHVYRTEQGEPIRMMGLVTNIEERKRNEHALTAANAQLAGVLDAATQVSIIATNVDGLITVFNSGAQNLLGYSADEMIGQQTPKIIHLGEEVVARGEELTRELGYKVEGFEVFVANAKQGRFDHREWTYVRKDGSHFTVSLVVTAVKNAIGEITGFLGVAEDITSRKRDEERFRLVVEAAPNAMVVIDPDRRITLVNSQTEELFGYKRQELIGELVEILVPDRFRPKHPGYVQGFFREPQVRSMGAGRDLSGLKKNGDEVPIELGLNPITTSEGTFVLASIIDITERKRTEAELHRAKEAAESASRAKSSFLANMSHEIRTPMNGIIGMSQLLARTELRSHQRDYLATVEESAHILLRLLNDILDFSKIEAGKLELESVDFRVSECVARASQMLVLRAAEKGLEVVCRVAPEIPDHLRGDPGRLQQVLVNLIGNAVKFTSAGEIFVDVNAESITPEQVHLHISVSDTGIGIPADKRDQIFRPFEQAETSTTRRFGGTGLGLTISRQLVEMMHGRMWIDSEVGRGSTFHFSAEFGVARDQHLHTPAELDSLLDLPVLVVDDNFTNRRILNEILQHWHMQPVLADSAAAARQALQSAAESRRPIRLILLDHHMPGEDGFHFVESVSGVLKREHCRIIMISSGSSPVDADLCQKHGIDRFMTKPVIASELLNEVLRQFGRYSTVAPSLPPTAASVQVAPRRVLLVEDNEINRRVAVGLLRSRGHQVVVAENGQEAVNTLAEQEFDVVLMDMQMPVMDGYEATIAIRKREHQTGGHIPIVAMTAEALKGDRERCLSIGMDDYVSKPIAPAAMYRAIERFPAVCLAAEPISKMREGEAPAEPHAVGENSSAGASPSRNPDVQTGQRPAIDWKVANKRLGGEPKVMREFSDLLKAQSPKLLADICRAVETRDYKLLRRSAHTMKGSVTYFGAEPLVQAALALETLGRSESLDGSAELLATLEQELARVVTALEIGPPD